MLHIFGFIIAGQINRRKRKPLKHGKKTAMNREFTNWNIISVDYEQSLISLSSSREKGKKRKNNMAVRKLWIVYFFFPFVFRFLRHELKERRNSHSLLF